MSGGDHREIGNDKPSSLERRIFVSERGSLSISLDRVRNLFFLLVEISFKHRDLHYQ